VDINRYRPAKRAANIGKENAQPDPNRRFDHARFDYDEYEFQTCDEYDDDRDGNIGTIGDDDEFFYEDQDDSSLEEDELEAKIEEDVGPDSIPPDPNIWGNFLDYAAHAHQYSRRFTKLELQAIELLATLRRSKACLSTYEAIMKWHLRANGHLRPTEKLGTSPYYIGREKLFKKLGIRYNVRQDEYNVVETITLPSSRAKARIIKNDTKACIQSLLTDPRIRDEDYLFHNDDPYSPPPDDLDYIGDLNTGQAYKKTYEKLIKVPGKQVLLPVIFYIDGAATGQFADLPVTAVKFSFGIFTKHARDRQHFWRTLGYIPAYSKHKSRGKGIMRESGHLDSVMADQGALDGEGEVDTIVACPAQDLHAMLEVIWRDFVPLQASGFLWSMIYKEKVYKDIEFVPFVPFIKCDTEEADKLCGAYTSRTGGISQLCRYCTCPNDESDDHLANYSRKTVPMISALIERNDKKGLKVLSQQNINNACYLLRFGGHNTEGVHGACPLEMLHALCLGVFKYVRDTFFDQIGATSKNADEINALAVKYGALFNRQSERDMPRTNFSNGIRAGKLMAGEYTGILLVLAAVLRSTEGRELLMDKTGSRFANDSTIPDWIMLVETLLQWQQWLKGDTMLKKHIKAAQKKHRFIMYLMRKISQRDKGRGLKLTKFHAILHMAADIMHFGVPMEYDTGTNESGHKATKTAAKLTQRRAETFDEQVGKRLLEVHMLDLAIEEIQGKRPLWCFLGGYQYPRQDDDMSAEEDDPHLGGQSFEVQVDEDTGLNKIKMTSRSKGKERMIAEGPWVDFIAGLQDECEEYAKKVPVLSTHYRNGDLFRGTPWYNKGVWRDWVVIDWGEDGNLPCKIWGFVDLTFLPHDSGVDYGGIENIAPGLYAIVESARYVEDDVEVQRSEIFVPITKDVGQMKNNKVKKLQYYLADVEAFVEPTVVIPDLGGAPNAYFEVKTKSKWCEDFIGWLEQDAKYDEEMYDDDWNRGKMTKKYYRSLDDHII